jgi:hypothetical protein
VITSQVMARMVKVNLTPMSAMLIAF